MWESVQHLVLLVPVCGEQIDNPHLRGCCELKQLLRGLAASWLDMDAELGHRLQKQQAVLCL